MANSPNDYIYNVRYETLLGRFGTDSEKKHLNALTYTEQGLSKEKPGKFVASISKDLTRYVQKLPAKKLPETERQSLLRQIAAIQSSADVYAIIDQLDPETDDDTEDWLGSGLGSK